MQALLLVYGIMEWWKESVIYQIYPRSFADGNGDGMGDLKGIINRLDYLKDLGIGGIWLSPHYPSPFLDCGYDVSDYCKVGAEYGDMDDFKEFLEESHNRGIKVILDLVMNHTSDQHPWFLESKSSKDNPKRDWYVWKPNNGNLPNDWQSCFKGPAWTLDEETNEYYYHFFLKEQPDLNWRNPEVKKAMFDSMRFWLDMGVDGFRIDAITSIFEDENLTNQGWTHEEFEKEISKNSKDSEFTPGDTWDHYMRYQTKQPELHTLLQEMRDLVDSYPDDKLLVGELSDTEYLGNGTDELHMVFNFPLMAAGITKEIVSQNQKERLPLHPKGSWQGNTLSNHDVSRIRSKYGKDLITDQSLKHSAFLMATLKGTPFIYYGEEIGMKNFDLDNIEDFMDLKSVNLYNKEIQRGLTKDEALKVAQLDTRDRCRTPMPWANSPNGGFSPEGIKTWLPVDPEYKEGINVADELVDKNSILNFYKDIINFRNSSDILKFGDYKEIITNNKELLIFRRTYKDKSLYVVINYSNNKIEIEKLIPQGLKTMWPESSNYIDGILNSGEVIILG